MASLSLRNLAMLAIIRSLLSRESGRAELAHQPGCRGKELLPVLPGRSSAAHEPDERFIHQRGRLQDMAVPFAHHLAMGQPMQLRVNNRSQPFERGRVAGNPCVQQHRHPGRRQDVIIPHLTEILWSIIPFAKGTRHGRMCLGLPGPEPCQDSPARTIMLRDERFLML
jgi:hypothetical protein